MRTGLKDRPRVAAGIIVTLAIVLGGAFAACRSSANANPPAVSLTLDPEQFQGDTKQAYIVAQQHPELLAQMHCYCGCEQHEGHKSLLDCFRDRHGAGCDTCVGEAVTAGKLADGGMPVDQIRDALRDRYSHGG
jgi:hypothetical protein